MRLCKRESLELLESGLNVPEGKRGVEEIDSGSGSNLNPHAQPGKRLACHGLAN